MTHQDIQAAVDQLLRSNRGSRALHSLMEWISDHGCGLDAKNQTATRTLLDAAWANYALTRRTYELERARKSLNIHPNQQAT